MSRRSARKNAFYLLFQLPFTENQSEFLERFNLFFELHGENFEDKDKDFIITLVKGTEEYIEEIDEIIFNYAKGWTPSRMARVDLSILRLAIYEMKFLQKTPVGVVINEAVELTKKFGTDESPAFVNGILGSIAKKA